jgi:hypothetical protein
MTDAGFAKRMSEARIIFRGDKGHFYHQSSPDSRKFDLLLGQSVVATYDTLEDALSAKESITVAMGRPLQMIPVAEASIESHGIRIYSPCGGTQIVYHNEWTALVCPNCKRGVDISEWVTPA